MTPKPWHVSQLRVRFTTKFRQAAKPSEVVYPATRTRLKGPITLLESVFRKVRLGFVPATSILDMLAVATEFVCAEVADEEVDVLGGLEASTEQAARSAFARGLVASARRPEIEAAAERCALCKPISD